MLAALSFWEYALTALFLVISTLLIVLVLLQKGRGGGLGAAFGGGGGAFGTRTGDALTWATIVLVGLFLLLAIVSSLVFRPAPQWIATPSFDVDPPGDLGIENKVKIACDTEGVEIFYTLDGADPDEDAIPYPPGLAVPVQPGQTLRARAYRRRWLPSEIAKATYGVAPVEPPTTAPGEGIGGPETSDPQAPPTAPGDTAAPGDSAPTGPGN